jgi:dTDP-4-amino-4,6-dideoxygalactose transaminase
MMEVPFCRVGCDGRELEYVTEVLRSGWLTTAGKTLEFERRFREIVGGKYACAVNSCTAALHLALDALGVRPGQKVFVPTMTFTSTAEVVRYMGADPVFLDVEYGTSLLTPEIVERAIAEHPDVRVLMLVHFGGHSGEMTRPDGTGILDICRRHQVRVVEDAAHAFPARWGGKMVGSLSDVTCFSFYANKTITTGEGGMLVTDDEQIYQRAKTMRLHGIDRDAWDRFTASRPAWEYDIVAPGYKYNLPDLAAAIGLAQLERAEEFRRERERVADFYREELSDVAELDLPVCRVPAADHAWHLFPVVLNELAPVSRNRFIEMMSAAGVGTSVHYKPLHRMSYYRQAYGLRNRDFPNAERTWQGCVSLPIYPTLSGEQLAFVCRHVKSALTIAPIASRSRAA